MANHAGNDVAYWASAPETYAEALYPLRKWAHLKMATENGLIWLSGFTEEEMETTTLLSIPSLKRYYLSGARLYALGKSLPTMVAPTLLWSDLRRGLKVKLPAENFNFFGVNQVHRLSVVPSDLPREVTASLVGLADLGHYLHAAPRVRTKGLRWVIINNDKALLIGTPLLPILGQDYYANACFLIPVGWKLEHETMADTYRRALGDGDDYWYILSETSELSKVRKSDFNALSKGSYMNSLVPL